MTYTVGELHVKAGETTFALVLAGASYGASGVFRLVSAMTGSTKGFVELAPVWVWLLPFLLLAGSVLLAGVTWLSWFGAVHETAEPFGVVRDGGHWRFWGWVIPAVNVIVPKRMVNDVWWTPDRGPRTPPPWQIQLWWALWGGAQLANVLQFPAKAGAEEVLAVTALLLTALSTPFAVWTVRLLTDRVTLPRVPVHDGETVAA